MYNLNCVGLRCCMCGSIISVFCRHPRGNIDTVEIHGVGEKKMTCAVATSVVTRIPSETALYSGSSHRRYANPGRAYLVPACHMLPTPNHRVFTSGCISGCDTWSHYDEMGDGGQANRRTQ